MEDVKHFVQMKEASE